MKGGGRGADGAFAGLGDGMADVALRNQANGLATRIRNRDAADLLPGKKPQRGAYGRVGSNGNDVTCLDSDDITELHCLVLS